MTSGTKRRMGCAQPCPIPLAELQLQWKDLTAENKSLFWCLSTPYPILSSLLSCFQRNSTLTGSAARKKKTEMNQNMFSKGLYVHTRSLQQHRRHFKVKRMCKVWPIYLCLRGPMLRGPLVLGCRQSNRGQKKTLSHWSCGGSVCCLHC